MIFKYKLNNIQQFKTHSQIDRINNLKKQKKMQPENINIQNLHISNEAQQSHHSHHHSQHSHHSHHHTQHNNTKQINKMQIQQHLPTVYGEWKKVASTQNQTNQNDIIFNRFNHCTFYYKNCIYYYGGQQDIHTKNNNNDGGNGQNVQVSVNKKQTLWNSFHKFNISSKQYSKQPLNLVANNSFTNMLANISAFGYFVFGNSVFLFGGLNYQTNLWRSTEMCSINLQSGTIKKYQSKTAVTSIPSQRLRPLMTSIQKNVLLLFGGQVYNHITDSFQYLNDMYTFKIETKTWTKIQDSYHTKFPILIRPSLVYFGDNCIYLLGGKRQILHNDGKGTVLVDNQNMYRCRIVTKTVNFKADCCVKQVFSTNPIPHTQTYIKIMKYIDKGIIVITTDIQNPGKNIYFWYYDPTIAVWSEIKQNTNNLIIQFKKKDQFAICFQKIIAVQRNSQVLQLSFNQSMLQNVMKQIVKYQKHILCSLCRQQKLQNIQFKNQIPMQQFQQFCPIQFPFAAVGLLIDNVCLAKGKTCNIFFNHGSLGKQSGNETSKSKFLLIQDNGYPASLWSPQMKHNDFINIMSSFYSTNVPQQLMAAEDNKKMNQKNLKQIQQKQKVLKRQFATFMKNQNKNNPGGLNLNPSFHFKTQKDFQKQQHQYIQKKQRLQHKQMMIQTTQRCKQFCNNIKLGGIKLGDTIIYACKQKKGQQGSQFNQNDKQIRRFFFMRKQNDANTNKFYYVCYAYVTQNGNAADPKMEGIIKFVSKQFKRQLKLVTDRLKLMNNVVLITDLKNISSPQQNPNQKLSNGIQMKFKKKYNDVYYGDTSILTNLQTNNIQKMSQCCDISLKTYLSLLYLDLGRDELAMYISVKQNSLQLINSQPFLSNIDKLQHSKKIIQVSKSMDFADQCSVVEIYWNPQFSLHNNSSLINKMNYLGLMLNGVLIYHRGRLVTRFQIQLGKLLDNFETTSTFGSIFGFMEIKPQYGTNIYHTNLFYPNAFEKYYAKLRFVNQFMESKYRQKRPRKGDQSGLQKLTKRTKHD